MEAGMQQMRLRAGWELSRLTLAELAWLRERFPLFLVGELGGAELAKVERLMALARGFPKPQQPRRPRS